MNTQTIISYATDAIAFWRIRLNLRNISREYAEGAFYENRCLIRLILRQSSPRQRRAIGAAIRNALAAEHARLSKRAA